MENRHVTLGLSIILLTLFIIQVEANFGTTRERIFSQLPSGGFGGFSNALSNHANPITTTPASYKVDSSTTEPAQTTTTAIITRKLAGKENDEDGVNKLVSSRKLGEEALVEDDDDLDDDLEDGYQDDAAGGSRRGLKESSKRRSYTSKDNLTDIEIEDYFGDIVKLNADRTSIVSKPTARVGLLTLKALILGPLIGITIKGAIIRGLVWAIGAYFVHLFFPALLSSLGLGSGLVGFARQLQPDYINILLPQLINMPETVGRTLPQPVQRMYWQYARALMPVIEYIRQIPEGACRYRAVCELSSLVSQNARRFGTTLKRLSATIYVNFGTDYSKAWLDGIVKSNCAAKYAQCVESPLATITTRLHGVLHPTQQ